MYGRGVDLLMKWIIVSLQNPVENNINSNISQIKYNLNVLYHCVSVYFYCYSHAYTAGAIDVQFANADVSFFYINLILQV